MAEVPEFALRAEILEAKRKAMIRHVHAVTNGLERVAQFRAQVSTAVATWGENLQDLSMLASTPVSAPFESIWVEWDSGEMRAGALVTRVSGGLHSQLVTVPGAPGRAMTFWIAPAEVRLDSDGLLTDLTVPSGYRNQVSYQQWAGFEELYRMPLLVLAHFNRSRSTDGSTNSEGVGAYAVTDGEGTITHGTVELSSEGLGGDGNPASAPRRSPRQHLRRGHWRRLPRSDARIWIGERVVGDPGSGAKSTQYLIRSHDPD